MPPMTDAPDTVVDAVRMLEAEGYTETVKVGPTEVECPCCDQAQPIERVEVEQVFRFEGESNPDDMSIVLAVNCPGCGSRGIVVSAYGPGADPEVLDGLVMLESRFEK